MFGFLFSFGKSYLYIKMSNRFVHNLVARRSEMLLSVNLYTFMGYFLCCVPNDFVSIVLRRKVNISPLVTFYCQF